MQIEQVVNRNHYKNATARLHKEDERSILTNKSLMILKEINEQKTLRKNLIQFCYKDIT